RQHPAVLLDHRHAASRVLVVDPRRTVGEVDLDRLELDVLLRKHDANARAIRAAGGVVQREHQPCHPCVASTMPSTSAICASSSAAGGSSDGDAAVRATSRTRAGTAPVRRETTVGFAPSATTSPGGRGPRYSGRDMYSSTAPPRSNNV